MTRWIKPLALLFALCLPPLGFAGQVSARSFQKPGRTPKDLMATYPGRIEHEHVAMVVEVLDADQTQDIFDMDLLRKGIQPLDIMISNESDQTYRIRKADVDAHYIPAELVARQVYPNSITTAFQTLGWLVWHIPAFVFPALRHGMHRPITRREAWAGFVRDELPDTNIPPHGFQEGLLFLRPVTPGSHITIKLLNVNTQTPLAFDIST